MKWLGVKREANNGFVREGVLVDKSGQKLLSVWREGLIDSLTDGEIYVLSNMNTGFGGQSGRSCKLR